MEGSAVCEPNTDVAPRIMCQGIHCYRVLRPINIIDGMKNGDITREKNSIYFVFYGTYSISIKCAMFYNLFVCNKYHITSECVVCGKYLYGHLYEHLTHCAHGFNTVHVKIGIMQGIDLYANADDMFRRSELCYLKIGIENLAVDSDFDADPEKNTYMSNTGMRIVYTGTQYHDLLIDLLSLGQARCIVCNMYYDSFPTKEIMNEHMNLHISEKLNTWI